MKKAFAVNVSRSEILRAGEVLVGRRAETADFSKAKARDLLSKWRALHLYPINTFQATIRTLLKKNNLGQAIVAQRLKREASIVHKLERFRSMSLPRMQDIGGIRIIVPSIRDVFRLKDALVTAKWKHELVNQKDYINSPKESGYRSYHLVYKYANSKSPWLNGLCIEIQIRTQKQHAWATAVETVGTFIGQALKSSSGEPEWLYFFELSSAIFSLQEKRTPHKKYLGRSIEDLSTEFFALEKKLDVLKKLSSFKLLLDRIPSGREEARSSGLILLHVSPSKRLAQYEYFSEKKREEAIEKYAQMEQSKLKDDDVVLVSVSSLQNLKKAYPNYFADTGRFASHIEKILKAAAWPITPPENWSKRLASFMNKFLKGKKDEVVVSGD